MLMSDNKLATASFLLWPLDLSVCVGSMLDPLVAAGTALRRVGGSKRGDK